MLPSWHTLSHSQADFLAYPALRTKGSAERPAQQALCTQFKHNEDWRGAYVYVGLEFGSTPAIRPENMPCRVLACFIQVGSKHKWMPGIFYMSEYIVHNVPRLQILKLYFGVHVASFTSTSCIQNISTTPKRMGKYVGGMTEKESNIRMKSRKLLRAPALS